LAFVIATVVVADGAELVWLYKLLVPKEANPIFTPALLLTPVAAAGGVNIVIDCGCGTIKDPSPAVASPNHDVCVCVLLATTLFDNVFGWLCAGRLFATNVIDPVPPVRPIALKFGSPELYPEITLDAIFGKLNVVVPFPIPYVVPMTANNSE
jgi:hypothetical protein